VSRPLVSVALLLAMSHPAGAYDGPDPERADIAWFASEGFCEPETVLPLPDATFLVSNVCGFDDSGSGYLALIDADGRNLGRVVDSLDSPLGMALNDGKLYVVDRNRVRVFRWPGYEPTEIIALETEAANDIAIGSDGTLYVTDSMAGLVVERRPGGSFSTIGADHPLTYANGIAVYGELLYVGGERLWRIDPSGNVETVGPEWLADIDGIEFDADGTWQVTIVGGPLVRYRAPSVYEVFGGEPIYSANHGYSAKLGLALIPTGFRNAVVAIRINATNRED